MLSLYTVADRTAAEEVRFDDHRSRSMAWEGSGHWLHQERPEECNQVVDAWLNSL
ncbi:MAG: alpha/beta fold hydrolase [Acidimicrobiales bacterium]